MPHPVFDVLTNFAWLVAFTLALIVAYQSRREIRSRRQYEAELLARLDALTVARDEGLPLQLRIASALNPLLVFHGAGETSAAQRRSAAMAGAANILDSFAIAHLTVLPSDTSGLRDYLATNLELDGLDGGAPIDKHIDDITEVVEHWLVDQQRAGTRGTGGGTEWPTSASPPTSTSDD